MENFHNRIFYIVFQIYLVLLKRRLKCFDAI
jgi:hypothetical protein